MDPDEDHFDPPQCDFTLKVTIVKEITVRAHPNSKVENMMDDILDEVKYWLAEDDVEDVEILEKDVLD